MELCEARLEARETLVRMPDDYLREPAAHRDADAITFWRSCVNKWASPAPEVSEVEGTDGRRLQLRFNVGVSD